MCHHAHTPTPTYTKPITSTHYAGKEKTKCQGRGKNTTCKIIGKFSYQLARKEKISKKTMFRQKGGGAGVEPQTCWSANRIPTTLLGSRYSAKEDPSRGTTNCSALLIKQEKENKKGDESTGIRTLHLMKDPRTIYHCATTHCLTEEGTKPT